MQGRTYRAGSRIAPRAAMIVLSAGLNARPQAADMVLRRGLARRAGRGDFE
jgi:hypothetical protein